MPKAESIQRYFKLKAERAQHYFTLATAVIVSLWTDTEHEVKHAEGNNSQGSIWMHLLETSYQSISKHIAKTQHNQTIC